MARYPQGQPVTIPFTVQQRNTDGTYSLADAATATTLVKLAQADGTKTTTGTYSSPTHISLGKYQQDVPVADLTGLGHYQYTVTTTGSGAGVQPGDFDVFDPFEDALLPLQDAKDHLNWNTTTTNDAEILSFIATIETSLEAATGGPLVSRVVTERAELDGTCTVLQLQQRPVVSVTSITPVATGVAADLSAGLDIDASAGTRPSPSSTSPGGARRFPPRSTPRDGSSSRTCGRPSTARRDARGWAARKCCCQAGGSRSPPAPSSC